MEAVGKEDRRDIHVGIMLVRPWELGTLHLKA
jgi:hypothetical protein